MLISKICNFQSPDKDDPNANNKYPCGDGGKCVHIFNKAIKCRHNSCYWNHIECDNVDEKT